MMVRLLETIRRLSSVLFVLYRHEHQPIPKNFLCEFNLLDIIIGYGIMCGDALTGYKALSSSRDCSGESMFCFMCL